MDASAAEYPGPVTIAWAADRSPVATLRPARAPSSFVPSSVTRAAFGIFSVHLQCLRSCLALSTSRWALLTTPIGLTNQRDGGRRKVAEDTDSELD